MLNGMGMPHTKAVLLVVAVFEGLAAADLAPQHQALDFVQLFKQGKDAFSCIRVPLLVHPPGGPLIVFATAHRFSCYDGGGANLVTRRSFDGGASWTQLSTLYNSTGGGPHSGYKFSCSGATFDPVSDSIILSCTASAGEIPPFSGPQGPYELWMWQSQDRNGTRWRAPVNLTSQLPYFVSLARASGADTKDSGCEAGPGHGLVLPSGRLLQCAECAHRGTACFYSDDPARRVWKEGGKVPPKPAIGCEVEAALLTNGSILLNMRSNGPFPTYPNVSQSLLHRLFARSDDGGVTFTPPHYSSDLLDPLCQASTISMAKQLYTSGPLNQTNRADMTISLSSDGESWRPLLLVWGGYSGYSSLVDLGGGVLGLAFEGEIAEHSSIHLQEYSATRPSGPPSRMLLYSCTISRILSYTNVLQVGRMVKSALRSHLCVSTLAEPEFHQVLLLSKLTRPRWRLFCVSTSEQVFLHHVLAAATCRTPSPYPSSPLPAASPSRWRATHVHWM
jgi:sialidase-1